MSSHAVESAEEVEGYTVDMSPCKSFHYKDKGVAV
jgi:hypothetical protein